MSERLQQVRDNVAAVRRRIADTAHAAGRDPRDIRLVAITKYVDAALAADVVEAGCDDLGESRPQELWRKAEQLAAIEPHREIRWHLIGHLQRNKVRRTLDVPQLHLMHSLDSLRLLKTLEKEAAEKSLRLPVLLEVNVSGDAEKEGFEPGQVDAALEELLAARHLEPRGLMAMAAREGGRPVARANFRRLRELFEELRTTLELPGSFDQLSMGMSGDLEEAVAEGATIVRIGSALFEGCL